MSMQADDCPQLRSDLRFFAPLPGAQEQRHTVYDPRSDLSFFLGAREMAIAQRFTGQQSLRSIAHSLDGQGQDQTVAKLQTYAKHLQSLGLLRSHENTTTLRDPAIGITYGPLKKALMWTVLRFNPTVPLEFLYQHAAFLCTRTFVLLSALFFMCSLSLVVIQGEQFVRSVQQVYGGHWSWLLWHYPVILLSIVVHEIGHAMPCRHYKVRLTDFGAAVYVLLATGWARPLQSDWAMLTRSQKMVAIGMGPWASLLFAAVGVWVWAYGDGWLHTLGVVMAVSSTLALVPTLLPMFNGDTYLAICEISGEPRLRQRAFQYVRSHWAPQFLSRFGHFFQRYLAGQAAVSASAGQGGGLTAAAPSPRSTRIWFFLILALTVLGWVLVWAVVGSLVYRVLFNLSNF